MNHLFRALPSMDASLDALLAADKTLHDLPRPLLREAVTDFWNSRRDDIRAGRVQDAAELALEACLPELLAFVRRTTAPRLRNVINGTGVVIHTNMGRSVLARSAQEAVRRVISGYCNLELDLHSGGRGSRYVIIDGLLQRLTGAEAGMVVNNNAAAVFLLLSALAAGRGVAISRGELVEIGGGFRVPDILARSGARLVEVGTTNKTRPADYAAALDAGEAQVLLKVHPSNFRVVGFTQAVSLPELGALARKRGVPLFCDLGSAAPGSPELAEAVAWADVCCFSGDKLLGGPQAGILLGKAEQLGRLRADPLFRALRPGKLALAALEATLLDWRDGTAVPVSAMLSAPPEELRRRAEALAEALSPLHPCTAVETQGEVGGGARPGESLPAWAAALEPAEALEAHLRAWRVPILGRIHRGKLLLDVRTLLPGDEAEIAAALAAWREERA